MSELPEYYLISAQLVPATLFLSCDNLSHSRSG